MGYQIHQEIWILNSKKTSSQKHLPISRVNRTHPSYLYMLNLLIVSVSHQNLDRRQSAVRLNHQHVKHRRDVRLKRSAKIVEAINTRIQNCCEKIEMLRATPALQPVQETLSFLETEIGALRHALETTTYVDVSTKEAKRVATERLKTIDAYITTMRVAFQPATDSGPVSYNSGGIAFRDLCMLA